MIPWLQAQVRSRWCPARNEQIEVILTPPGESATGLLMSRKEALAAAQALLQAVANESGVEVKISATPIPEILRCPNKVA